MPAQACWPERAKVAVLRAPLGAVGLVAHLVQRLGVEQGYNLAKESGRDLEEGIACATAGLRRRFAARVWRDYYKHVDARRRYANPTDEGLIAQQRDRQIEEDSRRRENEERVAQYNYFAARASNRSAWARAGMG